MTTTHDGEVGITTTPDLTRDAITTKHTETPTTWYRVSKPAIFAGFQQEWITGSDAENKVGFRFTAGAGVGSRYMVLSVTLPDGTTVEEYVDASELVSNRVADLVAEHNAEVQS